MGLGSATGVGSGVSDRTGVAWGELVKTGVGVAEGVGVELLLAVVIMSGLGVACGEFVETGVGVGLSLELGTGVAIGVMIGDGNGVLKLGDAGSLTVVLASLTAIANQLNPISAGAGLFNKIVKPLVLLLLTR